MGIPFLWWHILWAFKGSQSDYFHAESCASFQHIFLSNVPEWSNSDWRGGADIGFWKNMGASFSLPVQQSSPLLTKVLNLKYLPSTRQWGSCRSRRAAKLVGCRLWSSERSESILFFTDWKVSFWDDKLPYLLDFCINFNILSMEQKRLWFYRCLWLHFLVLCSWIRVTRNIRKSTGVPIVNQNDFHC